MDKEHYLLEAYRQLRNPRFYKSIPGPIHPTVKHKHNNVLQNIFKKGLLTKRQLAYLQVPDTPRDRLFYLLPKIHKNRELWTHNRCVPPGRPIVSDCSSDTYHIAEYIDFFLQPLATKHPSFLRDSNHFLKILAQYKPEPHHFLITLDVDSLYTNIYNPDGLEAVQTCFMAHPQPNRPDPELQQLLELSLLHNDFNFNNEWFLQISGTAMGKKFAPNYANIFLAEWERTALLQCPLKPTCFLRFLDDIFIIWPYSLAEFGTFFEILNNNHPTIKLKSTIDLYSTNFLDITIFKGPTYNSSRILDTKVYFKPTDTHRLLHKTSYHPGHTFKGILKSQILRYHRICSNPADFEHSIKLLFNTLTTLNYSRRFLRTIKIRTLKQIHKLPVLAIAGSSRGCRDPDCTFCTISLQWTTHVWDSCGKKYPLIKHMTCQTNNVIYLVNCQLCNRSYVNHTTGNLNSALLQLKLDIRQERSTPLVTHFFTSCRNLIHLIFTPLEHLGPINRGHPSFPSRRAEYWIRVLNTLKPRGLNLASDISKPLPIVIPFSSRSSKYVKKFRSCHDNLLGSLDDLPRQNTIIAYTRNPNLKDLLVSTNLIPKQVRR